MASGCEVYTPGKIRYFKLGSILQDEGKETVKLQFKSYLQGRTLDQYLNTPSIKSKLDFALKKGILRNEQYVLLFPTSGISDIDSYDITLLSLLIRCLHPHLQTNDPVWTSTNPTDMSTEADIGRIRDFKNQFWSHSNNLDISENDFRIKWQRLEMILTRLTKSIGNPSLQPCHITQGIQQKIICPIQPKPQHAEMATNTTDSLDREPVSIADTCNTSEKATSTSSSLDQVFYTDDHISERTVTCSTSGSLDMESESDINTGVKSVTNSSIDSDKDSTCTDGVFADTTDSIMHIYEKPATCKKTVATSTTTLYKKRKLSFKVKHYLEPFIIKPKNDRRCQYNILPKKESQIKRTKLENSKCTPCGCNSGGHFSRVSSFRANDHALQQHRCCFSGVAHLSHGFTVVADTTHSVVQVFGVNNKLIDEYECPFPRGICAISHDTVAIVLSKNRKVILLKFESTGTISIHSEVDIKCDSWLLDIKIRNKKLYILCDNGELHVYELQNKFSYVISCVTNRPVRFFDLSANGKNLFLSNDDGVVCMKESGQVEWRYRGQNKNGVYTNIKTTGVLVHKGRVFVSAWEDHKVIELDSNGKWIRDIGVENLQNPWAMTYANGQLYVTQYMPDLDIKLCQDIVIFKN